MRSYFLFCLPFLLIWTPAAGQAPLSATTKEKPIREKAAATTGKAQAAAKRRTVAAGAVTTGTVKTGTVATRAVPTGGGEKRARALSASKKSVRKKASAAFKPLVVQQTVSHPRNTDQISLIFREESAEFVTNVFLWPSDGDNPPRLGRFRSSMTRKLHRMKMQAERCRDRLENTVPLLSLIKYPRRRTHDPHAAVLTVGKEAVHEKHPCFKILSRLLQDARKIITACIECASYKRKGELIERTVTGGLGTISSKNLIKSGGKALSRKDLLRSQEEVKIFSEKDLDCIPKSDGKKECLDPQFGSFKI